MTSVSETWSLSFLLECTSSIDIQIPIKRSDFLFHESSGIISHVKDLISVIVPVYNVEKYLCRSVGSILSQTYENLEIILVDDGSTDSSGKICDSFAKSDDRVFVIHKANGGQGQARNRALDVCKGDYITFLDSDDYMEDSCVETLLNLIKRHESDIAVCGYSYVDEDDRFVERFSFLEGEHDFSGFDALSHIWNDEIISLAPWAKLFRRVFIKDFRFKECYCEDAASMPYLYREDTKVAYTGKSLVNYRLRMTSDVRSFSPKKIIMLDIFDEMITYAEENLPKNLQTIVKGKTFSVNIHVLFQLPEEEYVEERRRIRKNVRKYRWTVMTSPTIRRKARLAAFMSFFGYGLTKRMFQLLKKRNPAM